MRKKTIESLKTEVSAMVGMSGSKDGAQRDSVQSLIEAGVFYGYYRGLGHSAKGSAFLANKAIEKGKN